MVGSFFVQCRGIIQKFAMQDMAIIVCTPPPLSDWGEGGRLNLLPNFQKVGACQDLTFYRKVAGKMGWGFFSGEGCNKMKYLMTKNVYKQCFSLP